MTQTPPDAQDDLPEGDPPPAVIFCLAERDSERREGFVWQVGQKWPRPRPDFAPVSCVVQFILERNDEEEGRYFEIIGAPLRGGDCAERGIGVIAKIAAEDVRRIEAFQSWAALALYVEEAMSGSPGEEEAEGAPSPNGSAQAPARA